MLPLRNVLPFASKGNARGYLVATMNPEMRTSVRFKPHSGDEGENDGDPR